jgi:AcrR family transcriptional regulator
MPTKTDTAKKEQRHANLIDLTIDLIAERGVESCTFRNLATINGTTTRPFTYAFDNRANLLAAVARESWNRLGFAPGDAPDPGADPLARLYELCTRAVPVNGMCEPAMRAYAAVSFHSAENPQLRKELATANAEGVGAYLQIVKAAQRAGQIPAEIDPADLISAIWALSDGLILAAVSDPDHFTGERIERIWKLGFDALVSAD